VGWEWRENAGPYYYRVERCGRKVVKHYFGRGKRAEQAAREDAERRAARAEAKQAIREEMCRTQPAIRMTSDVGSDASLLLEAVLIASGLNRHNYGPWRVRRGG